MQTVDANVQDIGQKMLVSTMNTMVYEVLFFKQFFASLLTQGIVLLKDVRKFKHILY